MSQCPCGRFCFLSGLGVPVLLTAQLEVAMPLRAFLFSLANFPGGGKPRLAKRRNALAGVFVFSRDTVSPYDWKK